MLDIRSLAASDVMAIASAFAQLGWNKPASQYESYLADAAAGTRSILVATRAGRFAGYVTVKWEPDYLPFREANIPKVQDFNVLPDFRRQGIGSRLMDGIETMVARRAGQIGLGVALGPDYGAAQRMYAKRGYAPDGLGAMWGVARVRWCDFVRVDDDLVRYLVKTLAPANL